MVIVDTSNILFRSVFAVSNTFEQPFAGVSFIYDGRETVLISDPNDEEIEISKAGQNIFLTKEKFEKIWMKYNVSLVITSFLTSLFKIKRDFSASYNNPIILAVDGNNVWRKAFFEQNASKMLLKSDLETYKGQRKRDENKIIDWKILFEMYDETLTAMKNFSDFIVVKADGAEADDVIAVLAKNGNTTNPDDHIFIISSDEDFVQLLNDKIHLWSPHLKKFITHENPKKFLLAHILTGDKADNIPAVEKRMGDATAYKRIEMGLMNYLNTNAEIRERFEINKTLIDFSRIPKEISQSICDNYGSQFCDQYDQIEMTKFCWKHGLRKIVENMRDFKLLKNCSDSEIIASVKNKPNISKVMNDALIDFLNS